MVVKIKMIMKIVIVIVTMRWDKGGVHPLELPSSFLSYAELLLGANTEFQQVAMEFQVVLLSGRNSEARGEGQEPQELI